jgi:rhodanese-related sulfurtransferase
LYQALSILAISSLVAFGANALRPDGLPLLHAQTNAVNLAQGSGDIPIKDAAMLFISKRAVFLDARETPEYEQGHIQGAISLPVEEFPLLFKQIQPRLQGKDAVVTYCDGERCELSHELAEALRRAGIKNVWELKNGWTVWNAEKLPVEKK